MVKVPTKSLERSLFAKNFERVIGVDEVGMACLAGPVTVCALAVGPDFHTQTHRQLVRLRDSKALLPHQRRAYAAALMKEPSLTWRIASCSPAVIDEMNIYQASRRAMRQAISDLGITESAFVLVDGNKLIADLALPQQAIIKGDRKIWAIAAASIIAKVHRDALMTEYAKEFPGYGFEIHKGYPTNMHRERLKALGACSLHRRSFSVK